QNGGISGRVLVRGIDSPAALERTLRAAVESIDPQQPVTDVRTLETHRGESLSPYRLTALLMSIFACIALGVTSMGLGGVIAYSISQRTREIGIRIAIGAQPAQVLRLVLGRTLALVTIGAALGIVGALMVSGAVGDLVVGVAPGDPMALIGALVLLVLVAVVAGLVPARRAVRIDPLVALRGR